MPPLTGLEIVAGLGSTKIPRLRRWLESHEMAFSLASGGTHPSQSRSGPLGQLLEKIPVDAPDPDDLFLIHFCDGHG